MHESNALATDRDPPGPQRSPRRQKLVRPSLQLRLTAWFVGLAVVSVALQCILVYSRISKLALDLPGDSAATFNAFATSYRQILVICLLIVLPLTAAVGILTTFRIAGPIHRMSEFLKAVRAGEQPPACELRRGDELRDFCELLNEVTAPLRHPGPALDEVRAALPGSAAPDVASARPGQQA